MTERCGELIVRSTKCPSGCITFHLPNLVVPSNSKQICNILKHSCELYMCGLSMDCHKSHCANTLLMTSQQDISICGVTKFSDRGSCLTGHLAMGACTMLYPQRAGLRMHNCCNPKIQSSAKHVCSTWQEQATTPGAGACILEDPLYRRSVNHAADDSAHHTIRRIPSSLLAHIAGSRHLYLA